MKIVKHTINILIWAIVSIYLLAITLIHIPTAQRYIANQTAKILSEQLETEVKIERIDLGFLNRLVIDNIELYDQREQPLLKAFRVAAKIELLPLITQGHIVINSAQLLGADINIYQANANSETNCQFIIDKLSSSDSASSSPLHLQIGSLIIRNAQLKYNRLDLPYTPKKFNPAHLNLQGLSAHLMLKQLSDDEIDVRVKRLAFQEQTGFCLSRLSFFLHATQQQFDINELEIALPHSSLSLPQLTATYLLAPQSTLLKGLSIKSGSLNFKGSFHASSLNLSDLQAFLPFPSSIDDSFRIDANITGTDTLINIHELAINSDTYRLSLTTKGVVNLPCWQLDNLNFECSEDVINDLSTRFSSQGIALPPVLGQLGMIRLSANGRSDGTIQTLNAIMSTDIGELIIEGQHNKKSKMFSSSANLPNLKLNELQFAGNEFGRLTANIKLNGKWGDKNALLINADADIPQLEWRGYNYRQCQFNGKYQHGEMNINGRINDPLLTASLSADYKKEKAEHSLLLRTEVNELHPQALNLSDRWEDAVFSGQLNADLRGSNIDNIIGQCELRQLSMTRPDGSDIYTLKQLSLQSEQEGEDRHLQIKSDFGSVEIFGQYTLSSIPHSIISQLSHRMPTIPIATINASDNKQHSSQSVRNRFTLWGNIEDTQFMRHLLGVDLRISEPMNITLRMNDLTHYLAFHATLPYMDYEGSKYTDGRIDLYSPGDTLHLNSSIARTNNIGKTTIFDIRGHAADNRLSTSLAWKQQEDGGNSGEINTQSRFLKDEYNRERAEIDILPSVIMVKGARWQMAPSRINYSKNYVEIDHFSLQHQQQHILIDGKGTDNHADSIHVNLNDVDVSYVLDLVNFHSVEFGGLASGHAYIKAPFRDFDANARLLVKQFTFEEGPMGTLHALALWNKDNKRIDIDAIARDSSERNTIIQGWVEPSPGHIDLSIKAENTNISFLQSFTESFTKYVNGSANGEVRLLGPLSEINLTGELVVDGNTHIKPLGCTYQLRNDTVRFIPDEIVLRNIPIYDTQGNRGFVTGNIHHKHLTRLSYDLSLESRNMLVYRFTDFGNETFYGTVYGSGNVDITGRSGRLVIDADITPQPHSVFVYNVSSPDALTSQEFIRWGTASQQTLADTLTIDAVQQSTKSPENWFNQSSDLYINLLINTNPNAQLRLLMDAKTNDYITLEGNGVLRATYYNKGAFNLYGTYTVSHGTYGITIQDIMKKNFNFNEGGTIVFGGNPYDATLNLQAVHTVNGVSLSDLNIGNSFSNSNTTRVNCLMNITGQPRAPKVDFDLDLPTVSSDEKQLVRNIINNEEEMNQQVIYLLGIGRFYPQGNNNAQLNGENQQSQTSLAMQSLLSGTLSSQVNNVLNTVLNNNNWNFGANISTGNEGWNNAEYEGLLSGRLLNNRLLINGQFGYRDNSNTATSSFIGDFDVRYLLTPNGSVAVKVYNQTNDRYFTRSSLNTQGLGLILKKEFGRFSDLFSLRKKRPK